MLNKLTTRTNPNTNIRIWLCNILLCIFPCCTAVTKATRSTSPWLTAEFWFVRVLRWKNIGHDLSAPWCFSPVWMNNLPGLEAPPANAWLKQGHCYNRLVPLYGNRGPRTANLHAETYRVRVYTNNVQKTCLHLHTCEVDRKLLCFDLCSIFNMF